MDKEKDIIPREYDELGRIIKVFGHGCALKKDMAHCVCGICQKDMPDGYDTICYICSRTLCYDCAVVNGKHWECKECVKLPSWERIKLAYRHWIEND